MRIRTYPAVAFGFLIVAAAYLGLAPSTIPTYKQSDKVLHFVAFFLLTLCFYWILETNKRRNLQITLVVCPFLLGVGSEVVQGLLPNRRTFDALDIAANILGSLLALSLCMWYHKRMLERKRLSKTYDLAPGEVDEADLELGEVVGLQENGVVREQTLEQEVDGWDENASDWEADEHEEENTEGGADEPKAAKDRNE